MIDRDKGYKNFLKYMKQAGQSADIGIFENKKGADGESIAEYASANEFGKGMPERSFMRSTHDEHQDKILKNISKQIQSDMINGKNFSALLAKHGEYLRNEIIKKIRNAKSWAEGLSDKTKAAKGNDTILIESGNMWKAIDVRIRRT